MNEFFCKIVLFVLSAMVANELNDELARRHGVSMEEIDESSMDYADLVKEYWA